MCHNGRIRFFQGFYRTGPFIRQGLLFVQGVFVNRFLVNRLFEGHLFRLRLRSQGIFGLELFRQRLTHPANLDDNGYIRIPFSTSVNLASPLTAINKIDFP